MIHIRICNSFSTIVDGDQKEVGGFARIKTLIDEKKQEDPDTLVLDGGDFFHGNPDSDRIRNGGGRASDAGISGV